MFGLPPFLSLPFAVGAAVPPDSPESLALRKQRGDMFRNAIHAFSAGQPAPGQELGANLPTTQNLLGRGLTWLQQHADPNPGAYAKPATPPAPSMPAGSPMSPMPASNPWPTLPNGMNPPNPSALQFPSVAPPQGGDVTSAPAASPSPSPPQSLPSPQAPAGAGGAGGMPPWLNPDALRSAATSNDPFGAGSGFALANFLKGRNADTSGPTQPQGGIGGLMGLLKGGTDASAAIQNSPDKPFWNIARMMSNNGQSFAPGWKASNAWYNN